jgi:hypothetical protein
MTTQTIKIVVGAFIAGITNAIILASFDYIEGKDFRTWKFLFDFLILAIIMGFIIRNSIKKQG